MQTVIEDDDDEERKPFFIIDRMASTTGPSAANELRLWVS